MKKIIAIAALTLGLPVLACAQTTTNTKTICKGDAIPEGYAIIGEAESGECPNKAWVIKKRATPKFSMTQSQPLDPPATSAADANTGSGAKSSEPAASATEAIEFAKKMFEMLVRGDLAVEEMIDWDDLKIDGKDFGSMLKEMAAAAGKDMSSVRKEIIMAFGEQYKNAGQGSLSKWRHHSQSAGGTVVAANTAQGLTITFTVSTKHGRQIITELGESK